MKSGIWLSVSFLPAFFPFSLSYGLDFLTHDVFTFPMPLSWPRSFSHWRAPAGLAPPFTPLCVFSVAPWSPLLPSLGSSGPGVSTAVPALSCSCHTELGAGTAPSDSRTPTPPLPGEAAPHLRAVRVGTPLGSGSFCPMVIDGSKMMHYLSQK